MAEHIRIIGDKELERSFRKLRRETMREMRPVLKKAGELVRSEGASRFSQYSDVSSAGFKVRVRAKGVAVEQTLPRVTGLRGDYGALQMNKALVPALESKQIAVTAVMNSWMGHEINRAGF